MTLAQKVCLDNGAADILIVDDEPLVRDLLADYLRNSGFSCQVAGSGREALQHLGTKDFALVVSDIRMPELNGLTLLGEINQKFPDTAAIMITAVSDLETAIQTMKQGACDYITKPFHLEKVGESVKRALKLRQSRLENQANSRNLEHLVEVKSSALNSALKDLRDHHEMTLEALVKALDARGHETQAHSRRVQSYTLRLAREFSLSDIEMDDLARGALLHDIGKIGVPDGILLKPSPLSPEEWAIMKQHPTMGYQILRKVQFLDRVAWLVLCHHERYDGKGYPQGLRGEEIPLGARIFSVLDAFDAMTSDRPYRVAMSAEKARAIIVANAGSQFDGDVVREFAKVPQQDLDRIRNMYRESSPKITVCDRGHQTKIGSSR